MEFYKDFSQDHFFVEVFLRDTLPIGYEVGIDK